MSAGWHDGPNMYRDKRKKLQTDANQEKIKAISETDTFDSD